MKSYKTLEFDQILQQLENYAFTEAGKKKCMELKPFFSEEELLRNLRDTSEARTIIDHQGLPPFTSTTEIRSIIDLVEKDAILSLEQLEFCRLILTAFQRIKKYLEKSKSLNFGISYEGDQIACFEEIKQEIENAVRNGSIDDNASKTLRDLRKKIITAQERIKNKLESILKSHRKYLSEPFVVSRNGHYCIPVKAECKNQIQGMIIDKSSTGATVFMEPSVITKMNEDLLNLKMEEENEEKRILCILTNLIGDKSESFKQNIQILEHLDFIFAKGKLSSVMNGIKPHIQTDHILEVKKARHPLLPKEKCVPFDFSFGGSNRGIIVTGPNTGGKTVSMKTIGLLTLMAQSGLHIPCEDGNISMFSKVLCDIGDGQSITENLSTFSAHISNIISILQQADEESLVLLDELGSGTDPTEGMGIAVAVLEELLKSNCLFVVTTHYAEIKKYAKSTEGLENASMAFDKETLRPTYQLIIGEAGESCALYIAKKLGMPERVIKKAFQEAYKNRGISLEDESERAENEEYYKRLLCYKNKPILDSEKKKESSGVNSSQKILRKKSYKKESHPAFHFQVGDSVIVYPENEIGIVYQPANEKGEIGIQIKKKKIQVNHKRLKLHVKAKDLYPENYDFSIIFDSVDHRKKRHKMQKKHQPNIEIHMDKM